MKFEEWSIYQLVKLNQNGEYQQEDYRLFAQKIKSHWAIPNDAIKPKGERIKSGKYIKSEKENDRDLNIIEKPMTEE